MKLDGVRWAGSSEYTACTIAQQHDLTRCSGHVLASQGLLFLPSHVNHFNCLYLIACTLEYRCEFVCVGHDLQNSGGSTTTAHVISK